MSILKAYWTNIIKHYYPNLKYTYIHYIPFAAISIINKKLEIPLKKSPGKFLLEQTYTYTVLSNTSTLTWSIHLHIQHVQRALLPMMHTHKLLSKESTLVCLANDLHWFVLQHNRPSTKEVSSVSSWELLWAIRGSHL